MLGKSAALCAAMLLSCAHNVPQDKATGSDGKVKGARSMEFENGEARANGIVTYPGGDRVDWKQIELPEKQKGTLEFKLQWTPPRPGLQLAFAVFDEWGHRVVASKKTSRKRAKGRTKRAKLENAKGKYFVEVYAVGRGDAGKYKLIVEFTEAGKGTMFDPLALEIPDPPKLAAVPEPEVPCDPFDAKNPSCKSVCPDFGAPPGWPPCKDKCPTPPDVNLPSCQLSMPCPNPPDRRVKACKKSDFKKCDLKDPDPQNPNCDNATADPVVTRVMKSEVQGGETVITIGAGSGSGVGKGWRAYVLRGDSDSPLPGGEITVVRIDKQFTVGKVRLTADQLKANDRVKLSPK
ncbi:MAG TPA: hypothetical protein VM513_19190 [Kofleriaceae bacterium]|jgi:hypothetical protein|nr:hypothetical protein [Kofleriaceae bacterium]